jgi:hypothetical protein
MANRPALSDGSRDADRGLYTALEKPCPELLPVFHVAGPTRVLLDFRATPSSWAPRRQLLQALQLGDGFGRSSLPPVPVCERGVVQSVPNVWLAAPNPDAGGQASRLVAQDTQVGWEDPSADLRLNGNLGRVVSLASAEQQGIRWRVQGTKLAFSWGVGHGRLVGPGEVHC